MKINTVMSVYAIISAIFGVLLLLAPAMLISLYGPSLDAQAEILYRFIGGTSLGLAVMTWMGRDADASKSRDSMLLGLTVLNALSAIVAAMGALSGVYNTLAFAQAGLFAIFTIGFFLVGKANMSTSMS